eukprot:scaffold30879_cov32-Tisochrysis_lutea.AAC.6
MLTPPYVEQIKFLGHHCRPHLLLLFAQPSKSRRSNQPARGGIDARCAPGCANCSARETQRKC